MDILLSHRSVNAPSSGIVHQKSISFQDNVVWHGLLRLFGGSAEQQQLTKSKPGQQNSDMKTASWSARRDFESAWVDWLAFPAAYAEIAPTKSLPPPNSNSDRYSVTVSMR